MSDKSVSAELEPVWPWRRWRIIVSALVGAFVVVMFALVILVHHERGIDQATRDEVARSYVLRAHIQRVFSLVQDVEAGTRGFVITGQDVFLEPYDRARSQLPEEVAQLRRSAMHPSDQRYIAQLDGLVRRKLEIAAQNITARRGRSLEDAIAHIRPAQGKMVMDQIRGVLSNWDAYERRELDLRLAAADAAARELTLTLRGLAAGVVLIVTAAVWGVPIR